jgi:hypothetical protein
VMNEHLHKVFPLHIKELGDGEGPVEGEGEHVVPPHVRVQLVVGIVIPFTHTHTHTSTSAVYNTSTRQSVFRIRDILVRSGCGSSDPYL